MDMTSRRGFLTSTAVATVAAASGMDARAGTAEVGGMRGRAFNDQHSPAPLPFDPKGLDGLSAKLIQSHWENNYSGAVQALNATRTRLAQALGDPSTPPYVYAGLKREQLMRTGSVVLHEAYFGNLGGTGKAGSDIRSKVAASFGSFDAWESEFRKIGLGLAGGSGWVVLGLNRKLGIFENYWMADHATGPIDTTPILVMDMYEHAYQMDYGAAAAKYIDAVFANLNWEAVAARL